MNNLNAKCVLGAMSFQLYLLEELSIFLMKLVRVKCLLVNKNHFSFIC